MTKQRKLTLASYIVTLILLVLTLILTVVLKNNDNQDLMILLRYFLTFVILNGVLTTFLLVKEYVAKEYDKKYFIIKVVCAIIFFIIGSIMYFILDLAYISYINFLGLIVLLFVVNRKKSN